MVESRDRQDKSFKKDATNALKLLVENIARLGIYRVQRNNTEVYPIVPLTDNDIHILTTQYQRFEDLWVKEYVSHQYAFMTGGIPIYGENSELTIRINPMDDAIEVQYSIFRKGHTINVLSYPLELNMSVELMRPLLSDILYFEALSDIEDTDIFYESNVVYLEKKYPGVMARWSQLKINLLDELEYGHQQNVLTSADIEIWSEGIVKDDVSLHLNDEESLLFPSISIYGGEIEIDDHTYRPRATASMMEAAFMFRRDRYTPFMKMY